MMIRACLKPHQQALQPVLLTLKPSPNSQPKRRFVVGGLFTRVYSPIISPRPSTFIYLI